MYKQERKRENVCNDANLSDNKKWKIHAIHEKIGYRVLDVLDGTGYISVDQNFMKALSDKVFY